MSSVASTPLRLRADPAVPDAVLGMLIFVIAEVMFFAGLISAHTITEASAPMGWPPPGQPRLPIESTAFNTGALVLSGVLLLAARRKFRDGASAALPPALLALGLGAFFVFAQGVEWVALLSEGLTMTSSTHGAFFYLIVGAHGLHAIAAIGAVAWALLRLRRGALAPDTFSAIVVLWTFVVAIWPALYAKVYL